MSTVLYKAGDASEHRLQIGERDFSLRVIRHKSARRLRLRFERLSQTLRLTMPQSASLKSALKWAANQQAWVDAQLARQIAPVALVPGAVIPVEGHDHVLTWRHDATRTPYPESGRLIVGGPEHRAGARTLVWLKDRARRVLGEETRALAAMHDLPLGGVSIGDPRSRWGSCSAHGDIRYSWRLILAPPAVRLATVAHEVAHLRHMDHSAAFHAFVSEISAADPSDARLWLRREGMSLHRYTL